MASDHPDWTHPVTIETAKLNITHVTTIDQITKVVSGTTVEVINKATTVVQTGDAFKLLLHGTQTSERPGLAIAGTLLKQPYSALLVRVRTAALATVFCVTVSPSFTIGTPPVVVSPAQFMAACAPLRQFVTTSVWQAVVPIASSPTENLTIDIYTSASHTYTIDILGLTSNPGVQLRSDGRAYPIGSHDAYLQVTGNASGVLIAAPASPLRIMVRSVGMVNNYAGAYGWLTADTIRKALIYGVSPYVAEFETGLLLPPNTALNANHAGTGSGYFMTTYDLVV